MGAPVLARRRLLHQPHEPDRDHRDVRARRLQGGERRERSVARAAAATCQNAPQLPWPHRRRAVDRGLRRRARARMSDPLRLMLWHWGRRGGGPRYTMELARALAHRPGLELHLSLSRQSDLFTETN